MDNESDPKLTCIHPILDVRGKVKDEDKNIFVVSLKDCLACSGCAITEDEVTLLSKQDPQRILDILMSTPGFSAIISTAVIANYSASQHCSINKAYATISYYLKSMGASYVTYDSVWQCVWRHLLIDSYKSSPLDKRPFIISRCPGSVIFFERKTEFARYLAPIKPFTQLFALYSRKVLNSSFIVNVAPCFDRKLEIGRFPNEVDACLTLNEIVSDLEEQESEEIIGFPLESDVEYMLKVLSNSNDVKITNSGQTTEIRCGDLVGAYICGEAALQRLCANIKRGNCKYQIVEANFCPFGCAAGAGLIREETPLARKNLVMNTRETLRDMAIYDENDEEIKQIIDALPRDQIIVEYKSVQKTANDLTF